MIASLVVPALPSLDAYAGPVTVVPLSAIVRSEENPESYTVNIVVEENGKQMARRRTVKLGEAHGNLIGITEKRLDTCLVSLCNKTVSKKTSSLLVQDVKQCFCVYGHILKFYGWQEFIDRRRRSACGNGAWLSGIILDIFHTHNGVNRERVALKNCYRSFLPK